MAALGLVAACALASLTELESINGQKSEPAMSRPAGKTCLAHDNIFFAEMSIQVLCAFFFKKTGLSSVVELCSYGECWIGFDQPQIGRYRRNLKGESEVLLPSLILLGECHQGRGKSPDTGTKTDSGMPKCGRAQKEQ